MNYIFPILIIVSVICSILTGRVAETTAAAFSGAEDATTAIIAMSGIFCFWTGILKISEKSGLTNLISKGVKPILKKVFPGLDPDGAAFSAITMNVLANLLGLGNAATPAGIEAMERLDELNGGSPYPSREMCYFVILNTASIQLIPTTIMALRGGAGAKNPGAIMVPIWMTSALALVGAMFLMKIIVARRVRK